MYQFFESIKIENRILMNIEYHQERLDQTYFDNYSKICPFQLSVLIKVPDNCVDRMYKCRFSYDSNDYKIEFESYAQKLIRSLQLVFVDEIDYRYKFINRLELYNLSKQRGESDDILIVKQGQITDTSFCNIAFFDGKTWYTPDTYLLNGTCRKRLLYEGQIMECNITPSSLRGFNSFCVFNAMRGEGLDNKIPISNIIE